MLTVDGQTVKSRRLYIFPLVTWVILAALGYIPTHLLSGWYGIQAMLIAQSAVVAIVYITMLQAMRQMVSADKPGQFKIALKAGVVRFLLTLLVIVFILWNGGLDATVFLLWAGIAYIVMIKVEAIILIKWGKLLESRQK
ncbi:MAG: hypothetical protein ACYTF1_03395 [Planctomycetota bacterium]|jgi:hypothetical protein